MKFELNIEGYNISVEAEKQKEEWKINLITPPVIEVPQKRTYHFHNKRRSMSAEARARISKGLKASWRRRKKNARN